jgi:CBS domain-containing protein
VIDAAVRDVMQTDPVTVPPEMELRDLVQLFVEQPLAAAPVVDASGKLCGIVSERDIVLQEVEGDVHFPYFVPILDGLVFVEPFGAYEEQMQKAFAATVHDLMTRDVKTIAPDATIHEAAKKMAKHDVSRLVVVEGGRLVGVISRADVVRALAHYEFGTR